MPGTVLHTRDGHKSEPVSSGIRSTAGKAHCVLKATLEAWCVQGFQAAYGQGRTLCEMGEGSGKAF